MLASELSMPLFSAIGSLQWVKNRKRNLLKRYRLMNKRLNSSHSSTEASTGACQRRQELQRVCGGIMETSPTLLETELPKSLRT